MNIDRALELAIKVLLIILLVLAIVEVLGAK